jgi:MFS family permease
VRIKSLKLVTPLTYRPFRLLFTGQTISGLGDWLAYLALLVLVAYEWRLGPEALGSLAVAMGLPWVALAPLAGVWVDRWQQHKAVMVTATLTRALAVLGIAFTPNLHVLLPLVALHSAFGVFFFPAQNAFVKRSMPEDALVTANSLLHLGSQMTKVIGMAMGGVLVSSLGVRVVFLIDVGTFLVSAAFLARLPSFAASAQASQSRGVRTSPLLSEFKEGLTYIWSRPLLSTAIAAIGAIMFLVFTFDTLSPLLLKDLGLAPSLLGVAFALIAIGSVSGALLIGQWGAPIDPFVIQGTSTMTAGALIGLVGTAALLQVHLPPVAWLPLAFGLGVAGAGILVPFPYIVQRHTEHEFMGRVNALANGIPRLLQVAAPAVGAPLAAWQGVGTVVSAAGLGLVMVGIVLMIMARRFAVVSKYKETADVVAHIYEPPHRVSMLMAPATTSSFLGGGNPL